jgi:hypothetical protein
MENSFTAFEPEVAGELGAGSEIDTSAHPPTIHRLEYEFHGWTGDDIVTSFPVFLITVELKKAITNAKLTGATFDSVKITKSDEFRDAYPKLELPEFAWLRPIGQAGSDDIGYTNHTFLVFSARTMAVLAKFDTGYATTASWFQGMQMLDGRTLDEWEAEWRELARQNPAPGQT